MSKTVLFDLVFLTPRQKVSFGPRNQNDDFLGTRPRAAPLGLGSCQKNSSFFVLGTNYYLPSFHTEQLLTVLSSQLASKVSKNAISMCLEMVV